MQARPVQGVHNEAVFAVPHQVRRAALVAGDDRQGAGHGFQGHVGKGVVEGRLHEEVGGGVVGQNIGLGTGVVTARAQAALVAAAAVDRLPSVLAYDQQAVAVRQVSEGVQHRVQALASVAAADEGQEDVIRFQAQVVPRGGPQGGGVLWGEGLAVHAVGNDVQAFGGDGEVGEDFIPDHDGVADNGLQARAGEQSLFRAQYVTMEGAEPLRQAAQGAERARLLAQPFPMHSVPGPVDVATGQSFMGLNQVESARAHGAAGAGGEGSVTP